MTSIYILDFNDTKKEFQIKFLHTRKCHTIIRTSFLIIIRGIFSHTYIHGTNKFIIDGFELL